MFDENNIQEFVDIFLETKEHLALEEIGNKWAIKNSRVCFDEDLSEIEKLLQDNDIFLFDKIEDKWRLFTIEPSMKVVYWKWYDHKTGDGELKETEIFYSRSERTWKHYFDNKKFDTKKITKIIWKNF